MTGFECFATFVIRRAKHTPKGAARHWRQELCLGIKIKLMSFPIEQVRLNSFPVYLFLVTKICNRIDITKQKTTKKKDCPDSHPATPY